MNLIKAMIQGSNAGLAIQAAGAAAKALGLAPDTPPQQVVERIESATPEEQERLSQIEAEVATRTLELAQQNVEDARAKYNENKDWIAYLTGASISVAFLGTIGAILLFVYKGIEIAGTFEILLTSILSYVAGMMSNKVNFFWGASNSEAKK